MSIFGPPFKLVHPNLPTLQLCLSATARGITGVHKARQRNRVHSKSNRIPVKSARSQMDNRKALCSVPFLSTLLLFSTIAAGVFAGIVLGECLARKKNPDEPARLAKRTQLQNSSSSGGLVLGMGTGRCGTVTLSTLLSSQLGCSNSSFTHESPPILPWNTNARMVQQHITELLQRRRCDGGVVGDVALFYLMSARLILETYPDTRIIVLQRDRSAVVQSYARRHKTCNLWADCPHTACTQTELDWLPAFPKFPCLASSPISDGVSLYYDAYANEVARLALEYPLNVRVFESPAIFHNETTQFEMLHWAGFPSPVVRPHWEKFNCWPSCPVAP